MHLYIPPPCMKSASFTTLTLDLCSFEAAVWCTGSGLLSRLWDVSSSAAVRRWRTRRNPGAAAAIRGSATCGSLHRKPGVDKGGHSFPIREIQQDRGPKRYANQHQGSLDSSRAGARDRHRHPPQPGARTAHRDWAKTEPTEIRNTLKYTLILTVSSVQTLLYK